MTEKLQRLPRGIVEYPSLEILKNVWTESWVSSSRWPCLSRGIGLDDLQRCLIASTIL